MLDAQELNHHFSAVQILALESITVAIVMMLELAVQVNSNTVQLDSFLQKAVHRFMIACYLFQVPANCTDGQIRLRGGFTQREGRVEICIDRVWGTICDNSWDRYEAQVVCRQLGHSILGEYMVQTGDNILANTFVNTPVDNYRGTGIYKCSFWTWD